MPRSVKRLYTELKPAHYVLSITPDMQALRFCGTVTIDLKKTGRPSQRLTLHQNGLKIEHAVVIKHDRKGDLPLNIARINNQNSLQEVRLHTKEMVYSGDYTVKLSFSGRITRSMTGLYPCYFILNGEEHVMLATHFESHDARRVFPCIDEPEAKATFDLTIVAPKDMTVLANTPIMQETASDGSNLIATRFEPTPKMSTYLLAFAIGELQSVSTKTKRGTDVAIWATIAQPLDALEFALDVATRSIAFYEHYFGVSYPLSKLDHLALPDFSAGAMENWGLITYREVCLLAYKGETSQATREQIAINITHEISHQWFGNLVTMKWWDDLWLNESFAQLMEYQSLDALFPEWHIWDSFASSVGLSALRRDAADGVQAVKTNVRHPDEIGTLFDPAIVYSKGARLLHMLKTYIGEQAFQKGLSIYFKKHAYSNTSAADLWEAMSQASGIDVAGFMNPWLERSGFPVITVDQINKRVTLAQAHFLENGATSDRLWPVPLFSGTSELPRRLDKATKAVQLRSSQPVIVNRGSAGHYITHYRQPAQRTALATMIRQQQLDVSERLLILNSSSMLSKAGYEPFSQVLALLSAYEHEQSDSVWNMIALVLSEAKRFSELDKSLEPLLKRLITHLIAPEYQRLSWDERTGESGADRKLRATIVALGSYAEMPAIVTQAVESFKAYQAAAKPLPAEIRSTVFGTAVREQVPGAFEFLLDQHDHTSSSDLQSDIALGLSMTHDSLQAKSLLSRLCDARAVKPQDVPFWLAYLLRNSYTKALAWQWMVDHWSWIENTFKGDLLYDRFPKYAADSCNTQQEQEKFAHFFTPKLADIGIRRNVEIGLNEIATRVTWLERDLPAVAQFLKETR